MISSCNYASKMLSCYHDILLNALAIQVDWSYLITMTADAHEKVIWFDISVDEVLCVYIFNPADHLKRGKKSIIFKKIVSYTIKDRSDLLRMGLVWSIISNNVNSLNVFDLTKLFYLMKFVSFVTGRLVIFNKYWHELNSQLILTFV